MLRQRVGLLRGKSSTVGADVNNCIRVIEADMEWKDNFKLSPDRR